MADYFLPRTTGNLVDRSLEQCKNLGLILDKYPTQGAVQKSEQKGSWLREIRPDNHIDEQLAQAVYQRWLDAMKRVTTHRFNARTDWRMVVGLGGESVLETDLTLHHTYGIPFIPGSALKGLTRAYVTGEVYKSDKIENDNAEVQRIFGTQDDAGSVIFFDAMPVNAEFEISLDIMNAHYPDYYGEGKPPTNDQNPNPINFLTITNATFTFALAPRRADDPKHVKDVGDVQEWLKKALSEYGIGGKTSAGYGYLTVERQTETKQTTTTQQSETKAAPATSSTQTTSSPAINPEMNTVAGYIRELGFISNKDVPGRIQGYYQRWQKLTSNEARTTFAKAIIAKARDAMKEKALADRPWYKELREFLDKA